MRLSIEETARPKAARLAENAPAPATGSTYPVTIHVEPATGERNRPTVAFRIILAIPHPLLVGGPLAAGLSWSWTSEGGYRVRTGGGVLGAAMVVVAVIGWFAILFTGQYPPGLWKLASATRPPTSG